ncbi:MAG: hypothetical protein ACRDYY_11900 [Acidimicrobiales bacterium]
MSSGWSPDDGAAVAVEGRRRSYGQAEATVRLGASPGARRNLLPAAHEKDQ